jgi:hypothetical protein
VKRDIGSVDGMTLLSNTIRELDANLLKQTLAKDSEIEMYNFGRQGEYNLF